MAWPRYAIAVASIVVVLISTPSFASSESTIYLYDGLHRLLKSISSNGDVSIYNYDSVGNMLGTAGIQASEGLPSITSVVPELIYRSGAMTVDVVLTGVNLATAIRVTSDNPQVTVAEFNGDDTSLRVRISINSSAQDGSVTLQVSTLYGAASGAFTMEPLPPSYAMPVSMKWSVSQSAAVVASNVSVSRESPIAAYAPQVCILRQSVVNPIVSPLVSVTKGGNQ